MLRARDCPAGFLLCGSAALTSRTRQSECTASSCRHLSAASLAELYSSSSAACDQRSAIAPSDAPVRLDDVKQAGARSRRETSAIGSADDSSLDPVDVVRGLAHMDVLRDSVIRASRGRLAACVAAPRTAAERHVRETGHVLAFGCCRPYDDNGAAA